MSASVATSPAIYGRNWAVPYYVKGLALGIPVYLVAIHLWTWILIVPASLRTTGYDFRQLYAAAYLVRSDAGHQLYDYDAQKKAQDRLVSPRDQALPYVSPAYEALAFSPLAFLPFRAAYLVFLLVNLAALACSFVMLRPWMNNIRMVFRWLPIAIFLGFLPVAAALIQGQDSILLTTCLIATFVLLNQARNVAAGVFAGLALFKFPIVLPIALLFIIWRRWRFLAGFAISAIVLTGVSVCLTGIAQAGFYARSITEIAGLAAPTSGLARYPVNWRMMANIHGFMVGLAGGQFSASWLNVSTILLSAAVFLWTARKGLGIESAPNLLLLAVVCSVVVGHHTYIHDLSVLILPIVVLLNQFLPAEALGGKRPRLICRTAALMFVAPVIESYCSGSFFLITPIVFLLLISSAFAASISEAKSGRVLMKGVA